MAPLHSRFNLRAITLHFTNSIFDVQVGWISCELKDSKQEQEVAKREREKKGKLFFFAAPLTKRKFLILQHYASDIKGKQELCNPIPVPRKGMSLYMYR